MLNNVISVSDSPVKFTGHRSQFEKTGAKKNGSKTLLSPSERRWSISCQMASHKGLPQKIILKKLPYGKFFSEKIPKFWFRSQIQMSIRRTREEIAPQNQPRDILATISCLPLETHDYFIELFHCRNFSERYIKAKLFQICKCQRSQ